MKPIISTTYVVRILSTTYVVRILSCTTADRRCMRLDTQFKRTDILSVPVDDQDLVLLEGEVSDGDLHSDHLQVHILFFFHLCNYRNRACRKELDF